MSNDIQVIQLLGEIRDHLAILSEAALPAHDQAVLTRLGARAALLRSIVNTSSQWDSLSMMSGERPAATIAAEVGIDPSNFRKFVSRLASGGFVVDGTKGPQLTLATREVAAVRRATLGG